MKCVFAPNFLLIIATDYAINPNFFKKYISGPCNQSIYTFCDKKSEIFSSYHNKLISFVSFILWPTYNYVYLMIIL
jgi:hypothetical protein